MNRFEIYQDPAGRTLLAPLENERKNIKCVFSPSSTPFALYGIYSNVFTSTFSAHQRERRHRDVLTKRYLRSARTLCTPFVTSFYTAAAATVVVVVVCRTCIEYRTRINCFSFRTTVAVRRYDARVYTTIYARPEGKGNNGAEPDDRTYRGWSFDRRRLFIHH